MIKIKTALLALGILSLFITPEAKPDSYFSNWKKKWSNKNNTEKIKSVASVLVTFSTVLGLLAVISHEQGPEIIITPIWKFPKGQIVSAFTGLRNYVDNYFIKGVKEYTSVFMNTYERGSTAPFTGLALLPVELIQATAKIGVGLAPNALLAWSFYRLNQDIQPEQSN